MGADSRNGRDRRQHPRITCTPTFASMRVEGRSEPLQVQVLNVSGMGIGLILDVPIEPGSRVRVALPHTLVAGEICFCRPHKGQSFEAGLLITDVSADSASTSNSEEPAKLTVSPG
jgi:PilZ domain